MCGVCVCGKELMDKRMYFYAIVLTCMHVACVGGACHYVRSKRPGGYKVQSTLSFEQLHSTLNAIKCIHNIKESISLKTALCRIPVYHANKLNIRTFCARQDILWYRIGPVLLTVITVYRN